MPAFLRLRILGCAVLLISGCAARASEVRIEPRATDAATRVAATPATPPAPIADEARPAQTTLVSALNRPPPAAAPNPLAAAATHDAELLAAITRATGDRAEHYSVVVRRLRDARGASLNPQREYYAASLFKLALLYEAERQRSAGVLDFNSTVQVTARDVAEDLGTFAALGLEVGDFLPVRAAVQAMVTRSDNTSAVALLSLLGPNRVDATLRALGLTATSVTTEDLPTTAADMARLMEAVVRGSGVDPAWRDDALRLLLAQETRSGIPRLLPSDVRVGNKTGTWPGATHDVAFVDAPTGAYVIAVLSDLDWEWDTIARISRAVYDAMLER